MGKSKKKEKDSRASEIFFKISKDYEDLFLGNRSGHLTEYIYCGAVDYYEILVKKERNYYLTKSETALLKKHRNEIANVIGEKCNIIEIGPGPEYILKIKVIPLLKAFKNLSSYTAVDINVDYANQASDFVKCNLQNVDCYAYETDCTKRLQRYHDGKSCFLFLGGTIGNFDVSEINETFSSFSNSLNEGEYLIFSIDCNEDLDELKKAYNNSLVKRLIFNVFHYFKNYFNIENFDPSMFEFKYEWSNLYSSVYLNLIATGSQEFYFNNKKIFIPKNKKYHLVRSRRFRKEQMTDILLQHGFNIMKIYMDGKKRMTTYLIQKGYKSK